MEVEEHQELIRVILGLDFKHFSVVWRSCHSRRGFERSLLGVQVWHISWSSAKSRFVLT